MKALRLEPTERTPVWLMRQAGRYQPEYRAIREKLSFLELCHNSQLAAEVTVMAVDMLGVDAGIIFADILLPLEALECGLRFARGDGPVIDKPVYSMAQVKAMKPFDVEDRLGFVLEAISGFVSARPNVPLIGFAGAPFTLASYLIEGGSSRQFEKTKAFMYRERAAFLALMEILSEVTVAYLKAQVRAGADVLMLFDSWVGALSREDYLDFVQPYSSHIFRAIKADFPEVPTIHFGTATGGILDLMAEAGSSAMGVDWRMDLARGWEIIGHNRAVQGNLDPVVLLSDKDLIEKRVLKVLQSAGGRPGHIFNLGHGIGKDTAVENVKFLVNAVAEHSRR